VPKADIERAETRLRRILNGAGYRFEGQSKTWEGRLEANKGPKMREDNVLRQFAASMLRIGVFIVVKTMRAGKGAYRGVTYELSPNDLWRRG